VSGPPGLPESGRRPLWKRLLGLGCLALLGGMSASLHGALFLRFVPVPTSAVMVERQVGSWLSRSSTVAVEHRWVPLAQIAPCMPLAVVAAEDQNFTTHHGFDWEAIDRALDHNEKSRRKHGASTITQQTAKNLFLWSSRSWVRKGLEVYFTALLEATWPKRRILEVYLNIAEFGDGTYGVEAASRRFFGKSAQRLTPSEAALLAAVLPSPNRFRADAPSAYVRERQAWILQQMEQLGGEAALREVLEP